MSEFDDIEEEKIGNVPHEQILDVNNVIIKCDICHKKMTQSKNDAELFLCYQCNTRTFKSQLKVEQVIIPKREQRLASYKDDILDNLSASTGPTIHTEPEVSAKDYTLMHVAVTGGNEFYPEDPIKKEVKQNFEKILPKSAKIKVDLKNE